MWDEADLVARASSADDEAWRLIVERYHHYLWTIGRNCRLPDHEIADAVQDTWTSAVTSIADLREPGRLRGWLGTIMRRRCVRLMTNRLKRPDQLCVRELPDVVSDAPSVEDRVLATERTRFVREAVTRLPERDREIVRGLLDDTANYDEIARLSRLARGSIGPTRARILRKIRTFVTERHGDDHLTSA